LVDEGQEIDEKLIPIGDLITDPDDIIAQFTSFEVLRPAE